MLYALILGKICVAYDLEALRMFMPIHFKGAEYPVYSSDATKGIRWGFTGVKVMSFHIVGEEEIPSEFKLQLTLMGVL